MSKEYKVKEEIPDAAIVFANYAQFPPDQAVEFSCVESRMLLWFKAGKGTVAVNGEDISFEPGQFVFLPWGSAIKYQAAKVDPFYLAGIHLIPSYPRDKEIRYEVSHSKQSSFAKTHSYRKDVDIRGIDGILKGDFTDNPVLANLVEYIVQLVLRKRPPEWLNRGIALELLNELAHVAENPTPFRRIVPMDLERIMGYIDMNLERPLSLSDLVETFEISSSSIGRLFRKHLNTTAVAWITNLKMEKAKVLLRTERLTVAEVGERIGIPDNRYFSRIFKKHYGYSAESYQKEA